MCQLLEVEGPFTLSTGMKLAIAQPGSDEEGGVEPHRIGNAF